MKDSWLGKPFSGQAANPLPGPSSPLLTPPLQDVSPEALDLRVKCVQTLGIAGNRMIVEPSADHGTKPSAYVDYLVMHACPELLFDLLQRDTHPFGNRCSLNREPTFPGLSAAVRKAQEVERLRLAQSLALTTCRREAAELDEPGLLRVKLKTELLQALMQLSEESFAIHTGLESHDEIIGVADHDHRSTCVSIPPLVCPQVKDIVQKHVRKEW